MSVLLESPALGVAVSSATPLGYFAVRVVGGELVAVAMGRPSAAAARKHVLAESRRGGKTRDERTDDADDELAVALVARLADYADGVRDDFRDVAVRLDGLSPFQQRVVAACRKIPLGQVKSYGELAAAAGSPGAARAVGQVMASNCVPIVVPCHRVVRSGGGLGGFSAPQGIAMKERLLRLESAGE